MSRKPKARHPVTQPFDKPYRFIPLTQDQNATVDAADFEWLSQWNWYAYWNPITKSFYAAVISDGHCIKMQNLILGCSKAEVGDHKNHNTLDNRRENLRKCTHAQNTCNGRLRSTNTTGFRGIRPRGSRATHWEASIRVNYKTISLGTYETAELAAKAYDKAAKIYHGEFASLNFP